MTFLFVIYVLAYPFAILLFAYLLKKYFKKKSFLKNIIIAALVLQFLPLPRNAGPYKVDSHTNWVSFDPSRGEPQALGFGLPASVAKIYLGKTQCVVYYPDQIIPCPEEDRDHLPLRNKYWPGKFEVLGEQWAGIRLPLDWFNFIYSIIIFSVFAGVILIHKAVRALVKRAVR